MGNRPPTGFRAGWGVCALVLGLSSALSGQGTQMAGTPITNVATVQFEGPDGAVNSLTSNPVILTIGQMAGVDLEPPGSAELPPGSTAVFHHVLRNLGNGDDAFRMSFHGTEGWILALYADVDGDGALSASDTLITSPITVGQGGVVGLILTAEVPADAPPGFLATLHLSAESVFDGSVRDAVEDVVQVNQSLTTFEFSKAVDVSTASPGDTLTYTLRYRTGGGGIINSLRLLDDIPVNTSYLTGSLQAGGTAPGEVTGGVSAAFNSINNRIEVDVSTVASGEDVSITFQVTVPDTVSTGTTITNLASAILDANGGVDTVSTNTVQTVMAITSLVMEKTVEAPDSVTNGDEVVYSIVVRNPSVDGTAREIQVTDTLPDFLLFKTASFPEYLTISGRELVWDLPDLSPGDSTELSISTLVSARPEDPRVDENWASVRAAGGVADSDSARSIPLFFGGEGEPEASEDPSLSLSLTGRVLEVSLGQRVPVGVQLLNDGGRTLGELVVTLALPEGTRWIDESAPFMADSVRVEGQIVQLFLPGELAPGDSVSFHYVMAVVTAPTEVLETRAIAQGLWILPGGDEAGLVLSDQEISWIQARRNLALETRTVVGKVWADLNEDGLQSTDESGVQGVDIWTEDGERVTTDDTGKFSFVNLRPGRHGLRIDPESLPGDLVVNGDVIRMVEVTGWVSPRVSFPLVSRDGFAEGTAAPDETVGAPGDAQGPVRLAPLRREEDRAGDKAQGFVRGPGIGVFHPEDGAVLNRDRLFVGVRGEAGQTVSLFLADSLLSVGLMRPDGVYDFIGIPLDVGPQVLKVRMVNSWGTERWDSLRVHVSGPPQEALFETEEVSMEADGRGRHLVSFQLRDAWGVPVSQGPVTTVTAEGAQIVSEDADPSSVGLQLSAAANGVTTVVLQAGRVVGSGWLEVAHQGGTDKVALDLRAAVRPFMVTGVGNVRLGAGSENFGAVTATGRLGESTNLTLSYDSRRLDQGREAFGRSTDPLGEGQYAILGDASEKSSVSPSRYAFAARLERDHDWLAFGDLQTTDFARGLTLSRYTRALPGMAARVETGPITWKGFGALTTQTLRQAQLRGEGSSGPYPLAKEILPGTERVSLEVRALENATRIVSQRELQRYVDYQIDYERGTILLKAPVPASDPFGNPVFILVTYEAEGGGDRAAVWGGRASGDLTAIPALEGVDSLPVGFTFVQDDLALGRFRLMGGDLGLRLGSTFRIQSEVARAESPDSTDYAVRVDGGATLFGGALNLTGRWLRIGSEFRNPANRGLMGGTEEVSAAAAFDVGGTSLRLEHQEQEFETRGLSRSQSLFEARRSLTKTLGLQLQLTKEGVSTQGLRDDGGAGQVKLSWTLHPRLGLWAQGRRQLWSDGDDLTTGDFVGAGASWQLTPKVSLDTRHIRVTPRGDREGYSLTNLGVRSELASGAKAWGSYQLSGGIDGPSNAAILGLSHTFQLGRDWTLNGLLERRKGVQQAPLGDNVLALPFGGAEEDYWSTGIGIEHLPTDAPYRVSARGEIREGATNSNRLFTVTGDVTFHESLALLSRQEVVWTERLQNNAAMESRRIWSLWGLAFRPVHSEALNALAKVEWRDDKDPGGAGVLNTQGRDQRLIATGEVIWVPAARLEVGGRYSFRRAKAAASTGSGLGEYELNTTTDYLGAKVEYHLKRRVTLRMDLRLLNERTSGTEEWDYSPSILIDVLGGVQLQGGYRFGRLQDPDFAVRSGRGAFLNIGTRVSEGMLMTVADFWRLRLAGVF